MFDNEDLSETAVKQAKAEALNKLDDLIKQDISYNKILSDVKEQTKASINNVKEISRKKIQESTHVLDLRKKEESSETKDKKKKGAWKKLGNNIASLRNKAQDSSKSEMHYPESRRRYFNFSFNIDFSLHGLSSRIMLFALITALVLLPIRGLVLFGQITTDKDRILDFGKQGLINLQSGAISASENSYQVAQADFEEALNNFNQAQGVLDEYHQWMLNSSSLIPVVGKPLSLSRNMLAVATNIAEAATVLNQNIQSGDSLTEHLTIINQQIEKTIPYLEEAQKDLDGISTHSLPQELKSNFDSLKNYLPTITENLYTLNEIFTVLSDLLGHQAEKRYLVLFQNNNELRATGGFIGSFALFDVYQGKVIGLEIPRGGTYDLSAGQTVKIKSPQALSTINPYFNIWDANWWPDFPTSANKIMDFYQNSGGSSVNGVIAINAEVLRTLLQVLGPIELKEYDLTITSVNVFSVIQEEVELNYDKESNEPKAVIADLVPIVLDKLLNTSEKQKEIVSVLADMLATKDIQIYSTNELTQTEISKFGWTGEMSSNDSDYLYVVDTNIGGGKTDNDVYEIIDHQADIQANGEIINTVRITRTNKGDENNPLAGQEGGNVNYVRIHTPLGSEFIEAVGFDKMSDSKRVIEKNVQIDKDIAKEETDKMIDSSSGTEIYNSLDKTVFANWTMLKPGETQTISVKYKLPFKLDLGDPLVNNWWESVFQNSLQLDHYSLVIQAQSGRQNTIFNSSILLPDNVKVVWNNASQKQQMNTTDNLVTYSEELNRDQYFGFIVTTK